MKIYLVGGAVRDQLLKRPVLERDWVVVGGSEQAMRKLHFQPVGKDFPVFLHPETREEYALARTEKKAGKGYKGFTFHASADVTLKDDLARRDLTINAMAQDDSGEIIDPFNGQSDLKKRILRHVTPAFAEDPVRILRVGRFMARYAHLGFRIATSTKKLMRDIVKQGEVDALTPERVWKEWQRALEEATPQAFISTLRECGALARLLPELDALWDKPLPSEEHAQHTAITTGAHVLLTLEQSAILSNKPQVRFAALMHVITSTQLQTIAQRLTIPRAYRDLALLVARYHSQCQRALTLEAQGLLDLLHAVDAFRRSKRFAMWLSACQACAQGYPGKTATPYPQAAFLQAIFTHASHVDSKALLAKGYRGEGMKTQLALARKKAITAALQSLS